MEFVHQADIDIETYTFQRIKYVYLSKVHLKTNKGTASYPSPHKPW